jgi:hypothetical protein
MPRPHLVAKQQAMRRENRAKGLCQCGQSPRPGKASCQKCSDDVAVSRERWRKKRVASGMCHCGHPPVIGGKTCQGCRDKQTAKHQRLRAEVFVGYGGPVCACCGEDTPEFLEIDHIDGGGTKHRKEIGGRLYAWLRRNGFPPGFQVLCANCNVAKGRYGVCPHRRLTLREA